MGPWGRVGGLGAVRSGLQTRGGGARAEVGANGVEVVRSGPMGLGWPQAWLKCRLKAVRCQSMGGNHQKGGTGEVGNETEAWGNRSRIGAESGM